MLEAQTLHFPSNTLRCKCEVCRGEEPHHISQRYVDILEGIRDDMGEPLYLLDAYHCENHHYEMFESTPSAHNRCAFNIKALDAAFAYRLMVVAIKHGVTGFGFNLSSEDPDERSLHIDFDIEFFEPGVWSR